MVSLIKEYAIKIICKILLMGTGSSRAKSLYLVRQIRLKLLRNFRPHFDKLGPIRAKTFRKILNRALIVEPECNASKV